MNGIGISNEDKKIKEIMNDNSSSTQSNANDYDRNIEKGTMRTLSILMDSFKKCTINHFSLLSLVPAYQLNEVLGESTIDEILEDTLFYEDDWWKQNAP